VRQRLETAVTGHAPDQRLEALSDVRLIEIAEFRTRSPGGSNLNGYYERQR